jgi:hypothetical protein
MYSDTFSQCFQIIWRFHSEGFDQIFRAFSSENKRSVYEILFLVLFLLDVPSQDRLCRRHIHQNGMGDRI